ncbi:unnamed protein product, partial [Pocillopora meandrina]
MEQSQSNSMIDSAFCAIKWAHDMTGDPSPTDNPAVEAVRLASIRIPGTATSKNSNISFREGLMVFRVHKSKSDQHDATNEMMISELSSLAYPVK